ncbi:bifunctional tetrahydrofolate synthase/dihydrofolate synthase [Gammaproteobacteria bacterium]|nr:bifunctional tetrahydrofolate synthase/dihydrofolate synthase [Gammaproteobacteria bacterium]
MNVSDWLAYLETLHPDEIELGLDRVRTVAAELNLDFSAKTVITIAGTNGKGSTSCFLESLLRSAGKSTGLYSSPHLLKYNERIRINGICINDSLLCHAFTRVEQARKGNSLTYFEFGTLAALLIFAESELDYIILEVGLGGRLDAVNIIDADLAVITNIALDHTEWLGNTREKIAFEKAGIIRQDQAVIFGEHDIPESLLKQVKLLNAQLYHLSKDFDYQSSANHWVWQGHDQEQKKYRFEIEVPTASLLDFYPSNAAIALQAMLLLGLDIASYNLDVGICHARLSGRFQMLNRGYTLVLDVAHNPHAAGYLAENIKRYFPKKTIHIVIAMLSNKDVEQTLLKLQEISSSWYVASLKNSRGSEAKILYNNLQISAQKSVSMFESVQEAFYKAEQNLQANDVLLVTGSFYTVAAVLELI